MVFYTEAVDGGLGVELGEPFLGVNGHREPFAKWLAQLVVGVADATFQKGFPFFPSFLTWDGLEWPKKAGHRVLVVEIEGFEVNC